MAPPLRLMVNKNKRSGILRMLSDGGAIKAYNTYELNLWEVHNLHRGARELYVKANVAKRVKNSFRDIFSCRKSTFPFSFEECTYICFLAPKGLVIEILE